MKQFSASDAGRRPGRDCLSRTCGTNIDTGNVDFTNQRPNLVYLDKVFSYTKAVASPVLFGINTGGPNSDYFVTELSLSGGRCSTPCTLSPNAVFDIDNSYVSVEFFDTRPPGNINANQVTLDGFPVDSLSFANGLYTARVDNVLSRVQNERCLDKGLPSKTFFLISNAGPWEIRATFVLEGTVNTNGRTCRFRAVISNAPGAPNSVLPCGGSSNFAVRNLSLPCSINGVAPQVLFQFSAKANLVNPRLIVNCNAPIVDNCATAAEALVSDEAFGPYDGRHCRPPHPPYHVTPVLVNPCTVCLISNVAVEPVVNVQTVRRTLFRINASEGLQPCDGSVQAAESEDDGDCTSGGRDRHDCSCSWDKRGNNRRNRPGDFCDTSDISDTSDFCDTSDFDDTSDCDELRGTNRFCDAAGFRGVSECYRETTRTSFRRNGCNGCSW